MKSIAVSIVVTSVIIAGAIMSTSGSQPQDNSNVNTEIVNLANVNIIDGQQIIAIKAKGGYIPRKSYAKAGIPTVLRFNTSTTFDCSAYISIPSLSVLQSLPQSGSTDIKIENPKEGILQGSCGMGMYSFAVEFK